LSCSRCVSCAQGPTSVESPREANFRAASVTQCLSRCSPLAVEQPGSRSEAESPESLRSSRHASGDVIGARVSWSGYARPEDAARRRSLDRPPPQGGKTTAPGLGRSRSAREKRRAIRFCRAPPSRARSWSQTLDLRVPPAGEAPIAGCAVATWFRSVFCPAHAPLESRTGKGTRGLVAAVILCSGVEEHGR
jgi:hypothetical protein